MSWLDESQEMNSLKGGNVAKIMTGLIGLSALAFLLAVVVKLFTGPIIGVGAEGLSRSCSNLALIAIALAVCLNGKSLTR